MVFDARVETFVHGKSHAPRFESIGSEQQAFKNCWSVLRVVLRTSVNIPEIRLVPMAITFIQGSPGVSADKLTFNPKHVFDDSEDNQVEGRF